MKRRRKYPTSGVRVGTYKQFSYKELEPNPLNPRRLFDAEPLNVLEENIRKNGILVPLTVYQERNGQYYILDGERRWTCAKNIETAPKSRRKKVPIPANVVDPPTNVANLLYMFNIHNLREQWDLMPTALSLGVLMKELRETDDRKLAELTELSEPHVKRCKTLLSFPKKYQQMMLHPNPAKRLPANLFIEMKPVLDLYEGLPNHCRSGKSRDRLTDHFIALYRSKKIPSVIHFRRVLEAHDILRDQKEGFREFVDAAETLAKRKDFSIRQLFDQLVAHEKSVAGAEELCREFLKRMRTLTVSKTLKRAKLMRLLKAVEEYARNLRHQLEA